MTKKEAIRELKILKENYWDDDGYGHETKQYDDTMSALDMAIKALEQETILDEIRAEIVDLGKRTMNDNRASGILACRDIIDKYKAAEELRMEKHTDRQIYDGCLYLMQEMVDYFQEYLDYLGYDLDLLDEDERFAVGISNKEIVRQLFLYRTGNSGGCSTRDFCEKLGVDPYKSVKFEFERGGE